MIKGQGESNRLTHFNITQLSTTTLATIIRDFIKRDSIALVIGYACMQLSVNWYGAVYSELIMVLYI